MIEDKNLPLKEKFLSYFKDLPVQKLAADFIGKSEDTICDWKKKDPDFAYQIACARSEWARNNAKRVRSKEWLLERIMNDHFGQKIDITSAGKPIPILGGIVKNAIPTNDSDKKNP